jgi:hypothetical protein
VERHPTTGGDHLIHPPDIHLNPSCRRAWHGPISALKDETAGAGTRRTWLGEGLIVVQVAVSVLLLTASGLVVRSFLMVHRGPGFDP